MTVLDPVAARGGAEAEAVPVAEISVARDMRSEDRGALNDEVVSCLSIRVHNHSGTAERERLIGQLWSFRDGKLVRYREFPTCEDALNAAGLSE